MVVTKVQLDNLETSTGSLFDCVADLRGYIRQTVRSQQNKASSPRISIDPDRLMAAMMVLGTMWVAFFVWVYIDPPTGAGFVMMAAIFALIMQLAPPAKASLQFMAWGIGASFAGALYVFVMPHLSGYAELAALIFVANFAMYYLFGEPQLTLPRMLCMASFSILLMVDNQQTYSFSQWGGMTNAFAQSQNWSQYDGLSFWFYGTNSGTPNLRLEIKEDGFALNKALPTAMPLKA